MMRAILEGTERSRTEGVVAVWCQQLGYRKSLNFLNPDQPFGETINLRLLNFN
jgi:hypothetical protein